MDEAPDEEGGFDRRQISDAMKKQLAALLLASMLTMASASLSVAAQEPPTGSAAQDKQSQPAEDIVKLRHRAEEQAAAGDRKEAIGLYQKLLERTPDDFDGWMKLGRLLSWESRHDEALVAYQRALSLSPGNKDTRLAIAQLYAWKGDLKKSLELYQEVVDEEPANRDARLGLARALAWSNRYREAGELYRQMLSNDAGDLDARLGMAQVESWDERFEEALTTYRDILSKDPDNLEARLGEAKVVGWRGDVRESVDLYRKLVADHPDSAEAHQGLGEALAWQGMDGEALDQLRLAVKLDPDLSEAKQSLASLERQHRPEFSPVATFARDSDTNELSLLGGDLSFDASPQNRVRVSYRNFGTFNEKQDIAGHANLVIAGVTSRVTPDVTVRASLGTALLNPRAGQDDQKPVGALGIQYAINPRHNVNVGYARDVLLETPQLIANGLSVDTIDLGYRGNLAGDNSVSLGYSRSTYSDKNTSNLYVGSFSHTLIKDWPVLRVGYNQKFLEYDRQTFNGYFSPPTFQVGEAFLELEQRDPNEPWIFWLGTAGGYQKIYGETSQFVYRITGGVGHRLGDWGVIEVGGLTSNSALSSVAGYKYNAGTVRMNVRF